MESEVSVKNRPDVYIDVVIINILIDEIKFQSSIMYTHLERVIVLK